MPEPKLLKVFLCHSTHDKPAVRELCARLRAEGWIDPWLDEEKLYPGQDWDLEIEKAVEATDAVLACLSNNSVSKEGYVQRELRLVLRLADFKPEGALFIIPVRLDNCPMPHRLAMWQYVDYYPAERKDWAYQRLLHSLKMRAGALGIPTVNPAQERARQEQAEREQKEREQKARLDKEAQEKAAAEKARQEKEAREKTAADERARRAAAEKERRDKAERERLLAEERERLLRAVQQKPTPQAGSGQPPAAAPWSARLRRLYASLPTFVKVIGGIILFIAFSLTSKVIIDNWPAAAAAPTAAAAAVTPPASPTAGKTATPAPTPTATRPPATPVDTWISPVDGMVMVYVPEGEFTMGSDWYDDEKPIHKVALDGFWIDRTEVTNAMYALCVQAGKCDPPNNSSSTSKRGSYYGDSEFDDFPVIYVDWNDANTYCAWAGRRLPTEAEWEKAARGKDARAYPWGEGIDCQRANYNSSCVGDTSKVGSYPSGASPYGALDMAGNVWEWVADWYDAYPGNTVSNSYYGTNYRVLRGGSWFNSDDVVVRSANRSWKVPSFSSVFWGFRCARGTSP